MTELEDRYCASELELRNIQRQLQASQDECIALKEELTQYLTQINSVKESNFKLNRDLEDSNDQIQQLNIKYVFLCYCELFWWKVQNMLVRKMKQ